MDTISYLDLAQMYLQGALSAALTIPARELGTASGLVPPYCVYDLRPEPDRQSKSSLVWASFDATVRVVGKGSPGPLREHIEAIQGALKNGEVEGRRVEVRRVSPFSLPVYYQAGDNTPMQERGVRVQVRVYGG